MRHLTGVIEPERGGLVSTYWSQWNEATLSLSHPDTPKWFGRALEARRNVSGRATDWIVARNRLQSVESSNQRQITRVLDVIQRTLGFRISRGLLERPVYREFFALGLTMFGLVVELACAESQSTQFTRVGLIEDYADLDKKPFTSSHWQWQKPTIRTEKNGKICFKTLVLRSSSAAWAAPRKPDAL
jgi:hypothetical protein